MFDAADVEYCRIKWMQLQQHRIRSLSDHFSDAFMLIARQFRQRDRRTASRQTELSWAVRKPSCLTLDLHTASHRAAVSVSPFFLPPLSPSVTHFPRCSVCRGVFNQGYLCSKCGLGAHKECLGRFGCCGKTGNTPTALHTSAQAPTLKHSPDVIAQLRISHIMSADWIWSHGHRLATAFFFLYQRDHRDRGHIIANKNLMYECLTWLISPRQWDSSNNDGCQWHFEKGAGI